MFFPTNKNQHFSYKQEQSTSNVIGPQVQELDITDQAENGLVLASYMVMASQSTLLNGEVEEKIESARMERTEAEKE